jgi:hypothetical protein
MDSINENQSAPSSFDFDGHHFKKIKIFEILVFILNPSSILKKTFKTPVERSSITKKTFEIPVKRLSISKKTFKIPVK